MGFDRVHFKEVGRSLVYLAAGETIKSPKLIRQGMARFLEATGHGGSKESAKILEFTDSQVAKGKFATSDLLAFASKELPFDAELLKVARSQRLVQNFVEKYLSQKELAIRVFAPILARNPRLAVKIAPEFARVKIVEGFKSIGSACSTLLHSVSGS